MIKEEKFDAIWLLVQNGASDDLIMSTMNVERATLDRIKQSKGDFSEYKKVHAAHLRRISPGVKQKTADKQTAGNDVVHNITVQASHYMMEELKNQTKMLTLISKKMTAIMESLGVLNNESTL